MSTKSCVLLSLFLITTLPAFSQFKIGIKVAPVAATGRVVSQDSTQEWARLGASPRIVVGPFVDIIFAENYFFNTGILFAPKRFAIAPDNSTTPDIRNVQYVQVPLSLKLYTDEIRLDTRLFVQMGGVAEVKVSDVDVVPSLDYLPEVNLFDGALLFGGGVEYRWGYNTTVYGGFTYQRGLFNIVSGAFAGTAPYNFKSDLIGLDLGVKF
ncbi:MAG: outer membrane beta-barrel protein [Bacteroidota bacterium]